MVTTMHCHLPLTSKELEVVLLSPTLVETIQRQ